MRGGSQSFQPEDLLQLKFCMIKIYNLKLLEFHYFMSLTKTNISSL